MTSTLSSFFNTLDLESKKKLYKEIFLVKADKDLVNMETEIADPTSNFSKLIYLAWLNKHNKIYTRVNHEGNLFWVAEEGYEFDQFRYNEMNEEHIGFNIDATINDFQLEEISNLKV
jgi:hypothetical protein